MWQFGSINNLSDNLLLSLPRSVTTLMIFGDSDNVLLSLPRSVKTFKFSDSG